VGIKQIDLDEFEGAPQAPDIARVVRAAWHLPKGPMQNLVEAIEDARGIIISFDFKSTSIDAISHWQPMMPPLFFVNKFSPADRVRFTLSHEVGHMIMHHGYVDTDIERQADEFASELLMPEKEIRPYLTNLSLEKLATLKQYWKVSMAALLKRASDLGEITPRRAKSLWTQMGKAGYRMREPSEIDVPKEKPTLLNEIIKTYLVDMKYSAKELARYLCISESEVNDTYIKSEKLVAESEKRAAIKEAERIISDFNKNS
jgi:Zn-dependent peptidase ImmA (M78 family)